MNMKNNMKKTLVLPLVIILIATAGVCTASTLSSVITSNETGRYLSIETPYEVWEGQSFRIRVLEYGDNIIYNLPVENATVSWLKHDYLTNSTGYVTLSAPLVNQDTSFSFRVSKRGFRELNDHILVKDGSAPEPLRLIVRSSISEGCEFAVGVYSGNTPVSDATVSFYGQILLAGKDGIVEFTAPFVDQDTSFDIRASKQGYPDALGSILVLDENNNPLQLIVRSCISEGCDFTVGVYNSGKPVSDATVYFNGGSSITKTEGTVKFIAPFVDQDTSYDIRACKQGCQDGVGSILVLDENQYLIMTISPSITLDEGSNFLVTISSPQGPVPYAEVSWMNQTYISSDIGTVALMAPYVDSDTSMYISAQKDGYQDVGYYVLIRDIYHPHHPVDANADYRITISELSAYAATHGNDFNTQTGTDIWMHGEFYNSNLYVGNWCPFHPVDVNHDFNIQIEELTAYAASHGANDPDVQSATMLWQHGESYFFDYNSHNWMPVQ
jgi:hypothetical protein